MVHRSTKPSPVKCSARLREIDGAFRKDDVDGQAQRIALRRHLPHHVVGLGARLTKLEVGGAEHIRANRQHQDQHQRNRDRRSAQHSASYFRAVRVTLASVATTTV